MWQLLISLSNVAQSRGKCTWFLGLTEMNRIGIQFEILFPADIAAPRLKTAPDETRENVTLF